MGECVITLWRPSEHQRNLTREGKCLNIYGLNPVKRQYDDTLQLSSGRSTQWLELPYTAQNHKDPNVLSFLQQLFVPRSVTPLDRLGTASASRPSFYNKFQGRNDNNNFTFSNGDEADTVGVVIHSTPLQRMIS